MWVGDSSTGDWGTNPVGHLGMSMGCSWNWRWKSLEGWEVETFKSSRLSSVCRELDVREDRDKTSGQTLSLWKAVAPLTLLGGWGMWVSIQRVLHMQACALSHMCFPSDHTMTAGGNLLFISSHQASLQSPLCLRWLPRDPVLHLNIWDLFLTLVSFHVFFIRGILPSNVYKITLSTCWEKKFRATRYGGEHL